MSNNNFAFPLLGKLDNPGSLNIASSRLGVGFETLDRDMWDVTQAWPVLEQLGIKWARVQTGWAKTEKTHNVYDFTWLDNIVDNLRQRGVQPWLSVSYGNSLYTPGAPADATGYPPVYNDQEATGWTNYVTALTKHFADRITHYEVWNEPDASGFFQPKPNPLLYMKLVKMTATAIRAIQPDAKIIGGAMGSAMHPGGLAILETYLQNDLADYCDIITYHGYNYLPEQYIEQEFPAFKYLLSKYQTKIDYWQGESGCPSKVPPGNREALAEMEVSEDIQSRWLARRILLELGLDAKVVSYFTMGDFSKYIRNKDLGFTSHYGLLRLEDGTPKPAYYTLQNLAALLHDPLTIAGGKTSFRMQSGDDNNPITRDQAGAAYQVNLLRGDVPVHAWWLRERVENNPDWKTITMYYWLDSSVKLVDPVLIDPVSGNVYQLQLKTNYNMAEFANLPIANSPLCITDRSIVNLT